jgi:hypothetical protein
MSQHMVIFQTADGSPAYSQFESISEAVGFVESLRNDQGIENARMFELKEIKFELKPVFKVELKELNPAPAASAPSAAPAPSAPAPSTPSPAPSRPDPSPAPAPAASPGSGETTSFGGSFAPPSGGAPSAEPSAPAAPAPTPPADQPSTDSQPARRGLFGR